MPAPSRGPPSRLAPPSDSLPVPRTLGGHDVVVVDLLIGPEPGDHLVEPIVCVSDESTFRYGERRVRVPSELGELVGLDDELGEAADRGRESGEELVDGTSDMCERPVGRSPACLAMAMTAACPPSSSTICAASSRCTAHRLIGTCGTTGRRNSWLSSPPGVDDAAIEGTTVRGQCATHHDACPTICPYFARRCLCTFAALFCSRVARAAADWRARFVSCWSTR